jgi:xylulose-5-phosphate/fructose-6-phosphate phosphoketolase
VVFRAIGDGEAETGPLAASWHCAKFLNPATDGAVLPMLHLNGYKIANPTVLARIPEDELRMLLQGYGWEPVFVTGDDPTQVHQDLAAALDRSLDAIERARQTARSDGDAGAVRWPVVLRIPKGWTGPLQVDGQQVSGTFRSHQCRCRRRAASPSTSPRSSSGCGRTGRRSCSTSRGVRSASCSSCRRAATGG